MYVLLHCFITACMSVHVCFCMLCCMLDAGGAWCVSVPAGSKYHAWRWWWCDVGAGCDAQMHARMCMSECMLRMHG